ncbi:hybrid-cluster NAD(P)-dependent oxidoreductase [Streptomyces sp. AJS327]|uniref:hybrid-cluster NAD(P)-dependent oxidoreductase n=1 Tax=Streptomyces sp. AJS327 TaxID=2545265 RepID=UPI0015E02D9B|nr:hybrid-cluster NAD(P)-dependent oxidoreductase [Streptomyces sp. AJS327]MBA0051078.1 hybrid-cluster NAD(P)-dependent oxidoreductase [Streptomyces sp. AJS327]
MTDLLTTPADGAGPAEAAAPGSAPAAPGEWTLRCRRVLDVTHDTRTFVFEPVVPGLFRYQPGQHLAFTFEVDGVRTGRNYTLSSPPTRPHLVAITVRRVPGGRVSNWLHTHLTPGTTVRARGPLGRFSTARHPAPAYLFLSGGSGITPLMSMTRTLHDLAAPTDVVFLHSARTPADIPFRRELDLIAETSPAIRVAHVCEYDGPGEPRWPGHRGRLTPALLRRIVPDLRDRTVFACGPPGYLRAVRRMLAADGLPADRYHQEGFGAPAPPGAPSTPPGNEAPPGAGSGEGDAVTYTVELSRSGTTLPCAAGTPVLEAAARAGITLPSSCGQGVCGSCATTLLRGSVETRHSGGLGPRDEAAGRILLCCSTPLENLVVDA